MQTVTHPSFFTWLSSASSGPHVVGTDPAQIPHRRETGQLGALHGPQGVAGGSDPSDVHVVIILIRVTFQRGLLARRL